MAIFLILLFGAFVCWMVVYTGKIIGDIHERAERIERILEYRKRKYQ